MKKHIFAIYLTLTISLFFAGNFIYHHWPHHRIVKKIEICQQKAIKVVKPSVDSEQIDGATIRRYYDFFQKEDGSWYKDLNNCFTFGSQRGFHGLSEGGLCDYQKSKTDESMIVACYTEREETYYL